MSKSKVTMSADSISNKWGKRLKSAIPEIQAGIDAVTESPAQKAIEKADKMRANILKSIDDGTWQAGLSKVSLQDWKAKTKAKVASRLAGGVDEGMGKRKEFDKWLAGTLNEVLPEIANMPDMTLEDSKARVNRMMDFMANNKYRK